MDQVTAAHNNSKSQEKSQFVVFDAKGDRYGTHGLPQIGFQGPNNQSQKRLQSQFEQGPINQELLNSQHLVFQKQFEKSAQASKNKSIADFDIYYMQHKRPSRRNNRKVSKNQQKLIDDRQFLQRLALNYYGTRPKNYLSNIDSHNSTSHAKKTAHKSSQVAALMHKKSAISSFLHAKAFGASRLQREHKKRIKQAEEARQTEDSVVSWRVVPGGGPHLADGRGHHQAGAFGQKHTMSEQEAEEAEIMRLKQQIKHEKEKVLAYWQVLHQNANFHDQELTQLMQELSEMGESEEGVNDELALLENSLSRDDDNADQTINADHVGHTQRKHANSANRTCEVTDDLQSKIQQVVNTDVASSPKLIPSQTNNKLNRNLMTLKRNKSTPFQRNTTVSVQKIKDRYKNTNEMVVQVISDVSPQASEFINKISKTIGKKDDNTHLLSLKPQPITNEMPSNSSSNPYKHCSTPKAKKRNASQNQHDLGPSQVNNVAVTSFGAEKEQGSNCRQPVKQIAAQGPINFIVSSQNKRKASMVAGSTTFKKKAINSKVSLSNADLAHLNENTRQDKNFKEAAKLNINSQKQPSRIAMAPMGRDKVGLIQVNKNANTENSRLISGNNLQHLRRNVKVHLTPMENKKTDNSEKAGDRIVPSTSPKRKERISEGAISPNTKESNITENNTQKEKSSAINQSCQQNQLPQLKRDQILFANKQLDGVSILKKSMQPEQFAMLKRDNDYQVPKIQFDQPQKSNKKQSARMDQNSQSDKKMLGKKNVTQFGVNQKITDSDLQSQDDSIHQKSKQNSIPANNEYPGTQNIKEEAKQTYRDQLSLSGLNKESRSQQQQTESSRKQDSSYLQPSHSSQFKEMYHSLGPYGSFKEPGPSKSKSGKHQSYKKELLKESLQLAAQLSQEQPDEFDQTTLSRDKSQLIASDLLLSRIKINESQLLNQRERDKIRAQSKCRVRKIIGDQSSSRVANAAEVSQNGNGTNAHSVSLNQKALDPYLRSNRQLLRSRKVNQTAVQGLDQQIIQALLKKSGSGVQQLHTQSTQLAQSSSLLKLLTREEDELQNRQRYPDDQIQDSETQRKERRQMCDNLQATQQQLRDFNIETDSRYLEKEQTFCEMFQENVEAIPGYNILSKQKQLQALQKGNDMIEVYTSHLKNLTHTVKNLLGIQNDDEMYSPTPGQKSIASQMQPDGVTKMLVQIRNQIHPDQEESKVFDEVKKQLNSGAGMSMTADNKGNLERRQKEKKKKVNKSNMQVLQMQEHHKTIQVQIRNDIVGMKKPVHAYFYQNVEKQWPQFKQNQEVYKLKKTKVSQSNENRQVDQLQDHTLNKLSLLDRVSEDEKRDPDTQQPVDTTRTQNNQSSHANDYNKFKLNSNSPLFNQEILQLSLNRNLEADDYKSQYEEIQARGRIDEEQLNLGPRQALIIPTSQSCDRYKPSNPPLFPSHPLKNATSSSFLSKTDSKKCSVQLQQAGLKGFSLQNTESTHLCNIPLQSKSTDRRLATVQMTTTQLTLPALIHHGVGPSNSDEHLQRSGALIPEGRLHQGQSLFALYEKKCSVRGRSRSCTPFSRSPGKILVEHGDDGGQGNGNRNQGHQVRDSEKDGHTNGEIKPLEQQIQQNI